MKKEVDLTITSKQYSETLEPKGEGYVRQLELEDSVEIMTEGQMYNKNDALYITYDETEEGGLRNIKTLLKMTDDSFKIHRYGDGDIDDMEMELMPGVMNITRFKFAPLMTYDLEVYTNSYEREIDDEGYGKISVDYRIKFDRLYNRRNKLDVEVKKVIR